jgi:hypothetical protein
MVRLSGGDATFFDSIKFAFSRVHLILGWSVVSATVGLFLLFSVANTVFNTVLYHFATHGAVHEAFDADVLTAAFRPRAA